MAYYCNFNGTGGFTSATLGDLLTGAPKIKVVIKKFSFPSVAGTANAVFWQGGSGFSLREFVFRRNSTNFELYVGSTSNTVCSVAQATTAFGSAEMTCDEWALELDGTNCRLYKDGVVVFTKTGVSRSTGRLSGALFRLGCQPTTDTAANTASGTYTQANTTFGDVSIYINDVLVRGLVIPSAGTSIPDSVSGNNASQFGTWPSDNSEWVFYSSGTAYADTLQAGAYTSAGSQLASVVDYSSALQSASYTHTGSILSSTTARGSLLLAGSYTHSGSALGSAVGYSSTLQSGAFSYSGSELQSIVSNGAQNYTDTLLGGSFAHAGSTLQSTIARNSALLAGSYSHAGSTLTASLAFYSSLNGGAYSHFGSVLQSTVSGEVTVSIEGYTITFAADDVSGAFAADTVAATFINDYVSATWSN